MVKLRIDRGMSQTNLAKLGSLKQGEVLCFENLGKGSTLKLLFKLLKALDGDVEIYTAPLKNWGVK